MPSRGCPDVVGELDFDALRPLPDEYAGSRLDVRRGDRRWLLRCRDGGPLVVLEFGPPSIC